MFENNLGNGLGVGDMPSLFRSVLMYFFFLFQNLNADVLSLADLFESVGANLVSVSFAIPRVARVRPARPKCDLANRQIFQTKRELRFQVEEACPCPETRLDTYRKLKALHE